MSAERKENEMEERTRNAWLVGLALLLAISVFFNGWLAHKYSVSIRTVAVNS